MTRDTAMAARPKARIVLIGTGGTIAGHGASSINTSAYDCSVLSIDDILADLPVAASIADIRTEQLFQFGSENFGNPQLLQLGKRISSLLKRDNIDGIVVTHGTDTIDETAYFLHLTLKSTKPVVVVGAMRPPSALSSDGPLNLYHAIVVAASHVVKTNTFKQDAFRSPYGPLGFIVEGKPIFYRLPARRHTVESEWSID